MAYRARARTDSIRQSEWLHRWGGIDHSGIVPRLISGIGDDSGTHSTNVHNKLFNI